MNTRTLKWMSAGIIGLVMVQVLGSVRLTKAEEVNPIDPIAEEYILDSTVQIKLFAPLPANEVGQTDYAIKSYVMAKGLGTMVDLQGEIVIVTHNHWGDMLKDAEYVTIHDADGNQLIKLGMSNFTDLIRYSDPGTLVVDAPAGLPSNAAKVSEDTTMQPGEIIYVARQDLVNPDQVEVIQARMLRMRDYKGQSVYKLVILDNGVIVPGDSGGGNWSNGKLVGNTWASFLNTIKFPNSPETSLAAPLPVGYIQSTETTPVETQVQVAVLYE
jgi:hypothetical protein